MGAEQPHRVTVQRFSPPRPGSKTCRRSIRCSVPRATSYVVRSKSSFARLGFASAKSSSEALTTDRRWRHAIFALYAKKQMPSGGKRKLNVLSNLLKDLQCSCWERLRPIQLRAVEVLVVDARSKPTGTSAPSCLQACAPRRLNYLNKSP